MKIRRPEQALQIQIVNHLALMAPDVLAFHVPNGGKRDVREAMRFKAMGVVSGIPDLVCTWPVGRIGFIELKATAKDDSSDNQKAIQSRLRGMGFPVTVARSVEEALDALREWGAPIRGRIAA